MNYYFDKDKPIYKQIIDQIKIDIITNVYKSSEKLPSVRDLAISIKVNPNTINRALLELEEEGLIITKRTSGKFVTDDSSIIKKAKDELAFFIIDNFINDMSKLDISKKEILELLKERDK